MLLLPVAFWTTIHKHECDLSIEGGEGANVILCYNICDRDCSLKKSGKTAKFNDWFTIRVITGKSTDIHCFKTEAGTGSRQDLMVISLGNSETSDSVTDMNHDKAHWWMIAWDFFVGQQQSFSGLQPLRWSFLIKVQYVTPGFKPSC